MNLAPQSKLRGDAPASQNNMTHCYERLLKEQISQGCGAGAGAAAAGPFSPEPGPWTTKLGARA